MNLYLQRLKLMLHDEKPKKNILRIAKEVLNLSIKNRKIPTYYIKMYMYRQESGDYKDFLYPRESRDINASPRLHKLEYTTLLKNKLSSALYFQRCDLPVPQLLGYNVKRRYYYNTKWSVIENLKDLYDFFVKLMQDSQNDKIFLKHHGELGGRSCFLLKMESLKETLDKIGPTLLEESFIHQEHVEQHEALSRIYPHALNTIRFESYISGDKKKHIRTCYMRFGKGGHYVDNSYSGGIFIPVDKEKGQLFEEAYLKIKGINGGDRYRAHPDTGTVFKDFKIPFFKEAIALVFKCMDYVPNRYIGWDIAISKHGPVLIEGNGSPILVETPYGFKRTELGKEIIEEVYRK